MSFARALAVTSLLLAPAAAQAGIAIAGNDGKQIVKGDPVQRTPDTVSVLDLGTYPPKVVGTVAAPAAMIGSPGAIVVTKDSRLAIVTASQKYDAAHPEKPLPDDTVSVIDLANPKHPKVLQTLSSGAATAGGVALNPAQTLVLVTGRTANAVFAFTLKDKRLTPAGRMEMGAGTAPTDVVFAPDGKRAFVTAWDAGKVVELLVDGTRLTRGRELVTGKKTYGAVVTRDGNWLINTNVGGAEVGHGIGTLTMVDLKSFKLVQEIQAGIVTEHVALSPDGRYVALVLANGAATVKSDPAFNSRTGILRIYAVGAGKLTRITESPSCHWAQGGAWSDDGKLFLQQCAAERAIQVFGFDGKKLSRDDKATLTFESRPGSIATALSR